jgi:SSS family solute:Na+ symporter
MHFTIIDWVILSATLSGILLLGVSAKRSVVGTSDFLVAGRNVGLFLGAISLLSTDSGIITFLYFAEMGYVYGFAALIATVIPMLTFLFVGRTGFVIKAFRELELVTISEYFQGKYGRSARILAGVLMVTGGALNFGVMPVLDSTFLNILTGIPRRYILWTIITLVVIVLLYTALGGMMSVVVTSYVQYSFLFLSMIIVTCYCFHTVGAGSMVSAVQSRQGEAGFNPFIHPAFGWSFIFWQALVWLASLTGFAPMTIRAFTSESSEMGKKIFTWTGILYLGRGAMPILWGVAALAYFGGAAAVPIEAWPTMMRNILPAGITGLVVVGLLAGTMSVYGGNLIAWSSVITEDIIGPLARRPLSEKTRVRMNQITILCLAAFIVWWGLFYKIPGAAYFYLYMTANIFITGTFWIIVGGLYWKKAHKVGAYCSLLLGAGSSLAYFFVPNPDEWAGRLGFASFILSFAGMYFGSLIGTHIQWVKEKLFWLFLPPAVLAAAYFYWRWANGYGVWLNVWIWVLVISLASFTGLSLYALVHGIGDLKKLLRRPEGPQS